MGHTAVHWYQAPYRKFDEPEFYDKGLVATVYGRYGSVDVKRDGECYLEIDFQLDGLSSRDDFRTAFPDGVLPDVEFTSYYWHLNPWFDLYVATNGKHLDCVSFSLTESIEEARLFVDNEKELLVA